MQDKTRLWVKLRLTEISVALLVVWLVIQISTFVHSTQRQLVNPSSWFEVREIHVPDHASGSNPQITYDRIILEPFRGFWVVEAQQRDDAGMIHSACSGSGVSDYDPEEIIPGGRVSWVWFVGRACTLPPGEYRLRVSWDMTRPDWPVKQIVNFSNTFLVSE